MIFGYDPDSEIFLKYNYIYYYFYPAIATGSPGSLGPGLLFFGHSIQPW